MKPRQFKYRLLGLSPVEPQITSRFESEGMRFLEAEKLLLFIIKKTLWQRKASSSGLHQDNMNRLYSKNDPIAVLPVVHACILMR